MITVCFTGHRPRKLGTGYSITNERVIMYSELLRKHIEELITEQHVNTFISGGAIGIDQIAFWTVERLRQKYPLIKNIVAVPFLDQYTAWKNEELVSWYHKMIQRAYQVVYVDELGFQDTRYYGDTQVGEYSAKKMQLRNQYMVDHSDIVMAVHDGSSGGTANCVNYALDQKKKIIQLQPIKF